MKRLLTKEEKSKIHEEYFDRERAKHPGAVVKVVIADETDDNGEPRVRVLRFEEQEMPAGWQPPSTSK